MNLISYQSSIMRNKTSFNFKIPSPHPTLLPGFYFTPEFLNSSLTAMHQEQAIGIMVRSSAGPSSSHSPSPMLPCLSFLQFFMNSSSMCSSSQVQTIIDSLFQSDFPAESQVLRENLLQRGLLFHRVTGAARSLFQKEIPMESLPPLGTHLLRYGASMGSRVYLSSTMNLHGLWENPLSGTGAPLPSPSPLTFMSAGLFLPRILLLSPAVVQVFSPF